MPELPEVETVKRGLISVLKLPVELKRIEFFRSDLRFKIPMRAAVKAEGEMLLRIERRAKYLIFYFTKQVFISHLGMTGTWRWVQSAAQLELKKHDHIKMSFEDGCLVYNDPRRFGIFDVAQLESGQQFLYPVFENLGPEPLTESFSEAHFKNKISTKTVAIKAAIMDQKVVVGVGNIYASEALFMAQINPNKKANKLTVSERKNLIACIQKVLRLSIEKGGSSISDFAHVDENAGYFQKEFLVYGRGAEPCKKCQQPIREKVIAQRSTFWCAKCQK